MFDYANLKALALVVSEGGFDKAAKLLYVSQSAVSQRIKQLEDRMGQTLVIRSNPVTATPTGKRLLRHYHQVQLLESELRTELDVDDPLYPTRIAIAVNADSLATWFLPAITAIFSRHQWLLELIVDDESYTHNLLKDGAAVGCVTTTQAAMTGCSSEFLGIMNYHCVATPEFAGKYFDTGLHQASLQQAPAVVFSTKDKLHENYLQQHFQLASTQWWQHTIPSSEGFLDAIVQGLGYGLVGHLQSLPLIEQGKLIDLSPQFQMPVALYWQHWNIKAKHTSIIFRALASSAKQLLIQGEAP